MIYVPLPIDRNKPPVTSLRVDPNAWRVILSDSILDYDHKTSRPRYHFGNALSRLHALLPSHSLDCSRTPLDPSLLLWRYGSPEAALTFAWAYAIVNGESPFAALALLHLLAYCSMGINEKIVPDARFLDRWIDAANNLSDLWLSDDETASASHALDLDADYDVDDPGASHVVHVACPCDRCRVARYRAERAAAIPVPSLRIE